MTTILAGDISVDCACARKPIDFDVTRFCTIKLNSNNFVTLVVCVYLPTNYATVESTNLYRETVAELSGFLESCIFDNLVVVGDFNVLIFLVHLLPLASSNLSWNLSTCTL